MLERGEAAFEHGLGQRSDEVAATGCDLAGPLRVVVAGGAVSLVERVEPVGHAVAQGDGAAADRFGDGGVLALGVAGDVDAAAERDRAGVEALGEAGLAGADDAGEHEVRCGDEAAGVEDPRVVDERASGVEVLADEDAFAAEAAFGEERVRAGEGGRGVLMPREPEPAGCAERCRARLSSPGKGDGRALLGGERVGLSLRLGTPRLAVLRHPGSGGRLAQLPVPPTLAPRGDEYRRMESAVLPPGHSDNPRSCSGRWTGASDG